MIAVSGALIMAIGGGVHPGISSTVSSSGAPEVSLVPLPKMEASGLAKYTKPLWSLGRKLRKLVTAIYRFARKQELLMHRRLRGSRNSRYVVATFLVMVVAVAA